jgi:hypothetical protein
VLQGSDTLSEDVTKSGELKGPRGVGRETPDRENRTYISPKVARNPRSRSS